MKRMVASGRLGRKSGRGFYEYAPARVTAAAL
jgi:3-hydroxyacyl-CoA dehydrogenase